MKPKEEAAILAVEEMLPEQSTDRAELEGIYAGKMPLVGFRVWALRGGASIAQQGLFAGSHFLMNVLLARWLTPASYGAFALVYAIFLLLLMLYLALFYEPLLVYGPKHDVRDFSAYMRILVRVHFLILVPVGLFLAGLAPLLGRFYAPQLRSTLISLALLSPFLLLVWLSRAAFYAQLNASAGAVAGACYFVLLIGSLWSVHSLGVLSPASALGCMGLASVLVTVGAMYRFRRTTRSFDPKVMTTGVLLDHWGYGRWASLTALVGWIPANVYYALLPVRFGLESVATLRALMNLMYPLLHTVTALLLLLIPVLVRQREASGLNKMKRTVIQLTGLFVPAGIAYLLLLALFSSAILHLLYAGRYSDVSPLAIVAVGALPITGGIAGLLGAGLRALERPRLIFWSYVASAAVALVVGVPLTLHYGVSGTTLALLLNDLPTIAALGTCLARFQERDVRNCDYVPGGIADSDARSA